MNAVGFPRVPTLGDGRGLTDGQSELLEGIRAFVDSAALAALVDLYGEGEHAPGRDDLGSRLAWLDEFSLRWDYRAGKERNFVAERELPPQERELVLAAADALGLTGRIEPPAARYEHVLILGGLVRACIARPLHAARLLDSSLQAEHVTALGGYRPLGGNELPLAESFGMGELEDEFEVMDAGVRRAFALDVPSAQRGERSEVIGESWSVHEYASGTPAVAVIAAPSSVPGERRANTSDTYRWFASEFAHLQPGQRLLIVTTSIYVPFQHANAIRMFTLPFGACVDTVGAEPGELDSRLSQEFLPHNYLQEVRSTLRALRDLHAALAVEN